MKSRTSSFKTVLRKDITRFAPAWSLFTVLLILILLTVVDYGASYWAVRNMADWILVMAVINLFYALLTAQLLFGDLFNGRMCNGIHAMPLRREGLFGANVTAGLLFSLVPTLVTTLIAIPMCASPEVVNGWQVPLYWFLGSNLSYLCFFGIAVLCVQLTGNRFAMAVVYGILNFGAIIAFWLVDTIYTPMLYGVETLSDPFLNLTPVAHMARDEYLDLTRYNVDTPQYYVDFTLTEAWGGMTAWAVVGVVLLGLALLLYRKRNLECAGDFMAFKAMEPVFQVIYTLIVGTCFQYFTSNILGASMDLANLFVGILIGWFTGQMLLKRTIRVFRWKSVGFCVLLMALLGASIAVIAQDVFGIAGWLPESAEVETAYVYMGYSYNEQIPEAAVALTEQEDIETVIRIHKMAMTREVITNEETAVVQTVEGDYVYSYTDTGFNFTLIYKLKDGRVVRRYYYAYAAGEIGEILRPWFSSVEAVLGVSEEELDAFADAVFETSLDGNLDVLTDEQLRSLLEAIAADCEAGHMVQRWHFHMLEDSMDYRFYVEFGYTTGDRGSNWRTVTVYDCCENTLKWLEENDILQYIDAYSEEYRH